MPYAPSDQATLLLRKLKAPGTDVGVMVEWYYEPSTRDVHQYEFVSADQSLYSLDPSVIIDRWCLDAGQPPYTERRVTHFSLTSAGIRLTDVDGVTACQLVCNLDLTLTPSAVAEGRAYLTATVTGAVGDVLLSLDNFQTAGVSPDAAGVYEFGPLRVGVSTTYTVRARETRAVGCRATASVTLSAAYGPRYQFGFKDRDNAACLVQLYQREWAGAVTDLGHAQATPAVLDWPGDATGHLFTNLVRGSECRLGLILTEMSQLLPLYSGDERLFRVHVSRAGAEIWRGYLLPEQYDVAFLAPPNQFNLSATDGLGTLSGIPFVGTAGEKLSGDWTVLAVLLHCLRQLELSLPLHVRVNIFPAGGNTDTPALLQAKVDVSTYQDSDGKPWDCGKVLAALLTAYQSRIYQQAGAWWLERLAELRLSAMSYQAFALDGTRLADVTRAQPLTTIVRNQQGRPYWQGAGQRQSLRPAVARVQVPVTDGDRVNLLRFTLPKNEDLAQGLPLNWRTASSTGDPFVFLVFQDRDKQPLLRLTGTAGPQFGYQSSAQLQAAMLTAPFVELPVTQPLPLPFGRNGAWTDETLVIRIKYKAYGYTPSDHTLQQAYASVALKYGNAWLAPGLAAPESTTTVITTGLLLNDKEEQEIRFTGFGSVQAGSQPVQIRLYAPVGSATAATIDISEFSLEYEGTDPVAAQGYPTTYESQTGLYVSRADVAEAQFHSDTPHVRRAGTLLDAQGRPTYGWCEATAPGVVQDLADYQVAYRQAWQLKPAQVLGGLLRGPLPGVGVLLTDPAEARPAVYVLGAATYDLAAATWQVTGTQDLLLIPPVVTLPIGAIYNEDETAWEGVDGLILLYENA